MWFHNQLFYRFLSGGLCAFALVTAIPVVFAQKSEQLSPSQGSERLSLPQGFRYAEDYPDLKKRHQDDSAVSIAFEQAEADTVSFLNQLATESGGSEHSPEWITHCQNAVISARSNNWKDARAQLCLVLGDQKDLPDWILMKALADKKIGKLQTSLDDLEYLYKLRKERKSGYKTFWEIRYGLPDEYWTTSKILDSYSQTK